MVGLGDVFLGLVEFLRIDVRPGVLLAVHGAGLQRLVDFGEGHLLRVGTQGLELRRSEEHTSELQSLMRISYAVFCSKKKTDDVTIDETTMEQLCTHTTQLFDVLNN